MADIIGLDASAAGGGLFGLAGTVIGRIAGVIERRQENAQERARWTYEKSVLELQMRVQASAAEGQAQLAETVGAGGGLPPRWRPKPRLKAAIHGSMRCGP